MVERMIGANETAFELLLAVASAAFLAYGVVQLDWSPLIVVALFWAENILIAMAYLVRASVSAFRRNADEFLRSLMRIAFFAFVFFFVVVIHGVAIIALFGDSELINELRDIMATRSPQRDGLWVWALPVWPLVHRLVPNAAGALALAALASMHALRARSWIVQTRSAPPPVDEALAGPWGRILLLQLTLAGSVIAVNMMQAPAWGALLLVALKLAFDVWATVRDSLARRTGQYLLWSR